MSLIFVVLFVCLFPVRSHVSLLAFWQPVFNKLELRGGTKGADCPGWQLEKGDKNGGDMGASGIS